MNPYLLFSFVAVAIVLVIMLPLMLLFDLWWLWPYLIGINVASFGLYWYDKAIAGEEKKTRVPELVLHGVDLLGGTPAGFAAQRIFRHKVKKFSYQLVFWITVAVQVVVVAALWYFKLI